MKSKVTLGFPQMNKEKGEKRVFLPEFAQRLSRFAEVFIEEGYGGQSGFNFDDFQQGNQHVHRCSRTEAFQKDFVVVLRSPSEDDFKLLKPGACLISMLHFPTRPRRVELLKELRINAISMDSIVDDNNMRLMENMRAVAWNGLEAGFDILEQEIPDLLHEGQPYRVVIMGTGMVGKHAVEAATKLGSMERNNRHMALNGPGSIAMSIGRNFSTCAEQVEMLFHQTDVLVDATSRRDPSVPVVPNAWLAWLPKHSVIVDLAVDPYLLDHTPPTVRGIEGIPQGNLDKYTFMPEDPEWDAGIPPSIPSRNRRAVATCYSWPGIHPDACMQHYGRQLEPLMEVLLTRPFESLTIDGDYFARALARAKLPED